MNKTWYILKRSDKRYSKSLYLLSFFYFILNLLNAQTVPVIQFNNPSDLSNNFFLPDDTNSVNYSTEYGGTVKIDPKKSRILIYDKTPDGTPTNTEFGDFTASFRYKSDGGTGIWFQFWGEPSRENAWKVVFFPNFMRAAPFPHDEADVVMIHKGTNMLNTEYVTTNRFNEKGALRTGKLGEWTPIVPGNFYKVKLTAKYLGDSKGLFYMEVWQEENLVMVKRWTQSDITLHKGEIAIGARSLDGSGVYLDDFSVTEAEPIPEEEIYQTFVSGYEFKMRLPKNAKSKKINAIHVMSPASGTNTSDDSNLHEYYYNDNHNFAFIGFQHNASDQNLLSAINTFADMSGHPELKTAPLILNSFSAGTSFNWNFVTKYPEKVITYFGNSNQSTSGDIGPEARKIPGILFYGTTDILNRKINITRIWGEQRSKEALLALSQRVGRGHAPFEDYFMWMPFIEAVLEKRYPGYQLPLKDFDETSGWLADTSTWNSPMTKIYAYADYPGNKLAAAWLPNKDLAYVYSAYNTTNAKLIKFGPEPLHGLEGQSRTLSVTLPENFGAWTKMEFYDKSEKKGEITSGQKAEFTYSNLSKGSHSFIVHVTNSKGIVYTSYPATAVMLDRSFVTGFQNENELLEEKITVYPIPGNGVLTIQMPDYSGKVAVLSISDPLSKSIVELERTLGQNGELILDVSYLNPGLYMLNVSVNDKKVVKKIIIK